MQYGFIFIGFGDFKQLEPFKEETINIGNITIVKQLLNYSRCELKTVHRFDANELLQDAHAALSARATDCTRACGNGGEHWATLPDTRTH
eukprot:11424461-Alexandrium_andersonii.AAC.1